MADDATNKVKSLKQELREATQNAQKLSVALAQMNEEGSTATAEQIAATNKEMGEAVAKAAKLKDAMADANEQIGVLTAGSPFEKMSNSIGDVGSKIMALDFEGAKESAARLVTITKELQGPEGWKKAIGGVKDLGSTFMSLGKALLTNPLFLIAAAIALIVIAIVKLLDKIGLLKVITKALGEVFDWLMIPINAIIEGLKMLTDWFGWTNNAATDASKQMAENAEKTAKAYEEKSASIVSGYDHEIKMAELTGESTRKAELEKAYWILNTAKARAKADIAAYQSAKLAGELDEKEIADLKKKADASVVSAREAGYEITELKTKFREDDKKATDKANEDDLKAQEDANKKKADADKKAAEDAAKRREEQRKARIAADLYLRDLELANMQEGIEKEIAINEENYKRLRAQNAANALITAEQKASIDALLLEQSNIKKSEIEKKYNDQELARTESFNNQLLELQTKNNLTRIQQVEQDYVDQLKVFEKQLQDKLITQEQYNNLEKAAETKKNDDISTIKSDYATRDNIAKTSMMEDGLEKTLAQLDIAKAAELSALDLTEQEKFAIEEKYRNLKKKAKDDADKEELENIKKKALASLDATRSGLQGISDIIGAFAGKSRAQQKKAFEAQKKLNIAMATIDTIKGAVSAFTGMTSSIPGPVGIALGAVAAAGVVASGVANVKKISATQFDSGSGPSGGSTGANVASTAAQPSFNLIGNANEGNNATAQQSAEANQNITVNAVVSETEITNTQNKVSKFEKNAEL